ncbi:MULTISPECIES: hypothetical protein [Mycolicibacterium]|uniref:Uncharacterized protein n=1 Tax=Mycolicibacterium mucogenicum DSM 44124 TaxID=1226753 RepID=A0A8H2JCW1_MYCMU|nr:MULTISPECIES: hypothetical protein [Mycolicibacterium]KAB7753185.1 hypothetical protein MMUC44124_25625 [Mycolicibacterium mucogenicum DSM 44124]MCT7372251.1 hypothetical protein [Mycolicibacterium llatzerense]QPG67198.1 hypothetical protein C1S78_016590 [Mycolicibacterium mucogenicum DSM 44124]
MTDLLTTVLNTYGGVDRWRELSSVTAHKRFGGAIWDIKAVPGIVDDGEITVWIKDQRTSLRPFTAPDLKTAYTPQRVGIETTDGDVVEVLDDPRASFAGHTLETPWSTLQLAYFTGYAMWTYTAEPFNLTFPGVHTEEGEPWTEDGQRWRTLHVDYPDTIATHSPHQILYVDADGLIRRRDYQVDIAGGSPGAHYISDFDEIDGLVIPRTRMIYVRDADNHPIPEQLVVSIELTDITVN